MRPNQFFVVILALFALLFVTGLCSADCVPYVHFGNPVSVPVATFCDCPNCPVTGCVNCPCSTSSKAVQSSPVTSQVIYGRPYYPPVQQPVYNPQQIQSGYFQAPIYQYGPSYGGMTYSCQNGQCGWR